MSKQNLGEVKRRPLHREGTLLGSTSFLLAISFADIIFHPFPMEFILALRKNGLFPLFQKTNYVCYPSSQK